MKTPPSAIRTGNARPGGEQARGARVTERIGRGIRIGLAAAASLCLFATGGRPAAAQTYADRGEYLVTAVAACGNCHTPRDPANKPIPGMELAGGREFDIEPGHIVGPNITPDKETGIGGWTVGQIVGSMPTANGRTVQSSARRCRLSSTG